MLFQIRVAMDNQPIPRQTMLHLLRKEDPLQHFSRERPIVKLAALLISIIPRSLAGLAAVLWAGLRFGLLK